MKDFTIRNIGVLIFFVLFLNFYTFPRQSDSPLILDANPEETASGLEQEADELASHWNRQSIEFSIEKYLQAVEIWDQAKNKRKIADSFQKIARLKMLIGEKKLAEDYFNKALTALDRQMPAETSLVLSDLANLSLSKGEISKHQAYLSRSLRLAEKSKDNAALGAVYYAAAEYYYLKFDRQKSVELYQKSIAARRQVKDIRGESLSLLKLGFLYSDISEYAAAFESLESALSNYEQLDDLRGQAITLKALGTIYNVTNEKQKALEYYKKSEDLTPKDLDFFHQAGLSNSFGSIYEYYGDWQTSADYRKKALELFRQDEHLYGQLATLTSLFRLNSLMHNDGLALEHFEEANRLSAHLKDKFYRSLNETQLGTFHFNRERFSDAEKSYKKAFKLLRSGSDTRQISLVSAKLGKIYEQKKDWETAYQLYSASLEMNKKVRDGFAEADMLFNLSQIENLLDKPDALSLAADSIRLTETLYSDIDNSKLKRSYFSGVYEHYEFYINLLMRRQRQMPEKDYAVQALQAAEKSKARAMLENLALNETDFFKDAPPEVVRRENEIRVLLNSKSDQLTDLLSHQAKKPGTKDFNAAINELDDEINRLENELEDIKGRLKKTSPIYSAIKNPAPFVVEEFQREVLDENSLLLEYSFGKDESFLWLVGKNSFESYVLPPRGQIEARIEKLRNLLDAREIGDDETIENYQTRVAAADREFADEARVLSGELLGQIADKIKDKRLLIVPDGKLHYFPIAALPLPGSVDGQPILETNETIYEPSAATLMLLMRTGKKASAAAKNLLVFSDPIFSGKDRRIAANKDKTDAPSVAAAMRPQSFRFPESLASLIRLNNSQEEAETISRIVGESASTVFSGADANRENALDSSVADYKIVHFATHGLLVEDRPALSGIVLSQFDENGRNRNGVVRLQDIYAMNLSADAVILSACGTAFGKEIKGEGLASLNNAFLQTGAKSVVASLWKVDDYAAQELMKNFYQELTSGKISTAEALRRAQIKMRRNARYQSPFYWAAFTVNGDFKNSPQLSAGFDYKILALLVFPLSLAGFVSICFIKRLLDRKIVSKN